MRSLADTEFKNFDGAQLKETMLWGINIKIAYRVDIGFNGARTGAKQKSFPLTEIALTDLARNGLIVEIVQNNFD